jgi:hypothetical protein
MSESRNHLKNKNAPGRTRTPDPLLRRQSKGEPLCSPFFLNACYCWKNLQPMDMVLYGFSPYYTLSGAHLLHSKHAFGDGEASTPPPRVESSISVSRDCRKQNGG